MTQDSNTPGQIPPTGGGTSMLDATAPGGYVGPQPSKDECTMAMLCYILGIFTWFIGPLIIWLLKKDQSKFVDDQGKEVMNWEITITIIWVALIILSLLLHFIPILGWLLGFMLRMALFVCVIVFNIIGAMKANQGIAYRYPFSLRLIK